MQVYRDSKIVPIVETTFQAPHPFGYYAMGALVLATGIALSVQFLGTTAFWILGVPCVVLGVLLGFFSLRKRAMSVTLSSRGLRITDGKAIEFPWTEIDEVRTERSAVGNARTVYLRTITRSDGQQITLPVWLDADFNAAFDLELITARVPLMRDKLEGGKVLTFGPVTITPDSLRGPENKMAIDQLVLAEVGSGDDGPILRIQSVNETWPAIALTDVPNSAEASLHR